MIIIKKNPKNKTKCSIYKLNLRLGATQQTNLNYNSDFVTGGGRSRNTLKTMNGCVNERSGACVFGLNQGLVSGCLLIGNFPFVYYYFVLFLCCFCVHNFMPSTDNILIQLPRAYKTFKTILYSVFLYCVLHNFPDATTR